MTAKTDANPTLRQRGIQELKEFTILTVYFSITLGAVILMKAAVLHDHGIDFTPWGIAVVKAAVLAKFMLLGRAMQIGERFTTRPLIWPTLHKVLAFLVLLVVLTVLEEMFLGLLHRQPIAVTLSELIYTRLYEFIASILIMLLVLTPYCAIQVLNEALGEGRLANMFFRDRRSETASAPP